MSGENKRKNREDDEIQDSTPKRSKNVNYKDYFIIKGRGSDRLGICKLCVVPQEIKMKHSNTTGLKRHLLCKNEEVYGMIFPSLRCRKKYCKKIK